MRIALIATSRTSKLYPISLLKIGAYLKDQGHEVELFDRSLPAEGKFDEAWLSTLFTFEIPDVRGYIAEAKKRGMKVKIGGISASLMPESFRGEDIHIGMFPEAEKFLPDYSLLKKSYDYSIAWTSRGCIRKCDFCIVPKIEGKIKDVTNWEDTLNPDPAAIEILFFDNNWTAKPFKAKQRDKEVIQSMVDSGRIKKIDFNQGIDARLINEKTADIIEGMPFKFIRFAYDDISSTDEVKAAITLCAERGHREFRLYLLYNFMDLPVEFYQRIKIMQQLREDLTARLGRNIIIETFPMRYAPILSEGRGRQFTGRYWTTQQKKNIMSIMGGNYIHGMINTVNMEEFKYDWGQDEARFLKLISYPKLRDYIQRRKGNKRLQRVKKQPVNQER